MPQRAFGIYVHITWHTRFRQSLIRSADVDAVRAAIHEAASRWQVHVHEVAILSDHVHVIASFRPEGGVLTFIRHAKSESSRRINLVRGNVFQWGTWVFRGVPLADSCTGRVCLRRPAAREASGPRAAMSAADPGPAARGLPGRRPTLLKGRAYRASLCGNGGTGRGGAPPPGARPRRPGNQAAPPRPRP